MYSDSPEAWRTLPSAVRLRIYNRRATCSAYRVQSTSRWRRSQSCRIRTNRQPSNRLLPAGGDHSTLPCVLDSLCTGKVRSTTCSPANMLRLQFTSTAVNAAICARPECLCYPIAILQHQSNSHLARSTNLVVRGRIITHCTCSCCKYCRFVPLYQCCALSLCQECVRKAINGIFFTKSVVICAVSSCFPACPRPITMPSAT